jgi:hypothetical protein
MSDKKVVEVVYGKHAKYEIVKSSGGLMGSTSYYIHKNGQPHRGSFSSLAAAVEAARKEG